MRYNILVLIVAMFFVSGFASAPKEMQEVIFTRELLGRMVSMEEANKSVTPKNLTFIIDKKAIVENNRITLSGKLINNSGRDEKIIIFPVNMVNPFYVNFVFKQEGIKKNPHKGPFLPPVPPPPMQMIIPKYSEMVFSDWINLNKWEYPSGKKALIKWSFHFWNEPKPQGTFEVTLP